MAADFFSLSLVRFLYSGYTANSEDTGRSFETLFNALKSIYEGSSLAAQAIDKWLAENPNDKIEITY